MCLQDKEEMRKVLENANNSRSMQKLTKETSELAHPLLQFS